MKKASQILAGAVAALLTACNDGQDGKLTLKLTDAPGDVAAAVVTIEKVYLAGEDASDEPGVVLFSGKRTVELLSLANGTTDLVTDATVPSGRYGQLRFVITGGYVAVEEDGGTTRIYATSPDYEGLPEGAVVSGALRTPSFGTSGLKVNLDGGLTVDGDQHVLLVDFSVAESFGHEAGGSDAWVMHPVIRAGTIGISGAVEATATLAPGVTLPAGASLADVVAVLSHTATIDGAPTVVEETLPLADPDGDGTFAARFQFLFPGAFELSLRAPDGVTVETTPAPPVAVAVASGQTASVAFTVVGSTAAGPE
jgi:hypothetical protein